MWVLEWMPLHWSWLTSLHSWILCLILRPFFRPYFYSFLILCTLLSLFYYLFHFDFNILLVKIQSMLLGMASPLRRFSFFPRLLYYSTTLFFSSFKIRKDLSSLLARGRVNWCLKRKKDLYSPTSRSDFFYDYRFPFYRLDGWPTHFIPGERGRMDPSAAGRLYSCHSVWPWALFASADPTGYPTTNGIKTREREVSGESARASILFHRRGMGRWTSTDHLPTLAAGGCEEFSRSGNGGKGMPTSKAYFE